LFLRLPTSGLRLCRRSRSSSATSGWTGLRAAANARGAAARSVSRVPAAKPQPLLEERDCMPRGGATGARRWKTTRGGGGAAGKKKKRITKKVTHYPEGVLNTTISTSPNSTSRSFSKSVKRCSTRSQVISSKYGEIKKQ